MPNWTLESWCFLIHAEFTCRAIPVGDSHFGRGKGLLTTLAGCQVDIPGEINESESSNCLELWLG